MDREEIRYLLGGTIYAQARSDLAKDAIKEFSSESGAEGVRHLEAVVQGGASRYHVQVWLRANGSFVSASCDCPYNNRGEGDLCKHIGAVLLQDAQRENLGRTLTEEPASPAAPIAGVMRGSEYAAQHAARKDSYTSSLEMLFGRKWRDMEPESDNAARLLLKEYMDQDAVQLEEPVLEPEYKGTVSLEPELTLARNSLPEIRLRISGGGRQYIVKSIPALLEAVEKGQTVSYGQQLSFLHRPEAFTDQARALLALLRRPLAFKRYLNQTGRGLGSYLEPTSRQAGAMALTGDLFDEFVALCQSEGMVGGYELRQGIPAVQLEVEKKKGGAQLTARPKLGFFEGMDYAYAFSEETLWQMSRADFARVRPVLQLLSGESLFFAQKDLAAFCSYVVPEFGSKMQIQDPDRLLMDQIALEPVVQFYLDLPQEMVISVRVEFLYGEDRVTPESAPLNLRRDPRTEHRADRLLKQYLQPDRNNSPTFYQTTDDDEVYRFLEEGVPALMAAGEVYLSEAFRNFQAPPPRVSVGVSVSGSVLDLEVDTGEFPAEELRAMLRSFHQKKRYHRLRDGRILRLDDSLQALDELNETLALSGAKLTQGHSTLPLYRAPSLDRALAGQSGLHFRRDDAFRRISRSFHAVKDSEYVLPPSLQKVLRKYQRDGYRWLRTLDGYGMGGILADDMGLGKTLQVLAYLLALKEEGQTLPSLIVCPASLVLNWAEECEKFTPQLKCLPVDGTAAHRAELAAQFAEYDLIVTSYDLLRRDEALYTEQEFYACILDEAQAIKNHTTQKYKAVCRVQSKVRFALTGTPVENRLGELWSIFTFLMPGYLPPYKTFSTRFERPIVQEKDQAAVRRLNQLTGPFILRRMKAEVLRELPPKTENVYRVALGGEQRKLYLAAVLDAKEKLRAAKPEDRVAVFAVLMRLRQICCDPRLTVDNWTGSSAKLDACADLISAAVEGGHRVLLFSQFTSMLSLLEAKLDEMGVSHFTLQGSTPKPLRAELVRRFNGGEASVFLISLRAGGTGLNLTAADIVLHYDPWWNVAAQNQATDRAYRIGQRNAVQVYKLIAQDTIEEKILELQQAKQDLAETVTGGADGAILSMRPEELLALLGG